MRIWDVPPAVLCRQHLLGEHRELHAVWTIITEGKRGYCRHPEVLRWHGKLQALYRRHEELVAEMRSRGYRHHSALDPALASGDQEQDCLIDDIPAQIEILRGKRCGCAV